MSPGSKFLLADEAIHRTNRPGPQRKNEAVSSYFVPLTGIYASDNLILHSNAHSMRSLWLFNNIKCVRHFVSFVA